MAPGYGKGPHRGVTVVPGHYVGGVEPSGDRLFRRALEAKADFAVLSPLFGVPEKGPPLGKAAFENLQKLETAGTFSQGGMKLVDANDPTTYKVRRGKVGGYREDFNAQQVAELEALVRDNILPELGYCQDGAGT